MSKEAEDICRVNDDVLGFREEVVQERNEEAELLRRLRLPLAHARWWDIVSIVLLLAAALLIILEPLALLLWIIVGILLYSYNFIIILLPTTTEKSRPEERAALKEMGLDETWLAIRLLLKKKYLAIELGITVFLGGMVPLAASFSVILGMGLLLVSYALVTNAWALSFVLLIVVQLVFILGFYLFVVLLAPQEQGITRLAKRFKRRIDEARMGQGGSVLKVYLTIIALAIVSIILVIGAMLLPGITLVAISLEIDNWGWRVLTIVIFVFVVQLIVMRHFQGMASRRMAVALLQERVETMNKQVLEPLDTWTDGGTCLDRPGFEVAFMTLKKNFYSIAVYDVIRVDIFGRSPVYLVGPRLRYVLNDKVLECF